MTRYWAQGERSVDSRPYGEKIVSKKDELPKALSSLKKCMVLSVSEGVGHMLHGVKGWPGFTLKGIMKL